MKLVCAWCGSAIERSGYLPMSDRNVSHGMCPACSQALSSQDRGVTFQRHIDGIPTPILLVDANNITLGMNAAATEILGRKPESSAGLPFGLVFDCVYSRLPEGCGRGIHCSGCAIRKTVAKTFETGEAQIQVPATLSIENPDQLSSAAFAITTAKRDGVVLLRVETVKHAGQRVAVMGCSFEFDEVNNVLRYRWEGILTDELLLEGDANARKLLAARPPCRGILDFSRITKVEASTQTIKWIASKPPAYGPGQAVILVAPQDVVYGLSRMFATLGEKKRPSMHVVRTMDEAYQLLEIDSPQFSPISVP